MKAITVLFRHRLFSYLDVLVNNMPRQAKRYKKPRTLNEPFRSFREIELAVERARASYCFFQHKVRRRSLRDVAKELRMSYERVRDLSDKAENVYGLTIEDFTLETDTDRC